MKSAKRLEPVLEKARECEQTAARALVEARARVDSAEQKLAELQTYRGEYAEGLRCRTDAGLNALQVKDYHAFLGRLDEAIRQQQQILDGLAQATVQARDAWLQQKQRLNALDKLNDRNRRNELADSERREQVESNEYSLRLWQRGMR